MTIVRGPYCLLVSAYRRAARSSSSRGQLQFIINARTAGCVLRLRRHHAADDRSSVCGPSPFCSFLPSLAPRSSSNAQTHFFSYCHAARFIFPFRGRAMKQLALSRPISFSCACVCVCKRGSVPTIISIFLVIRPADGSQCRHLF